MSKVIRRASKQDSEKRVHTFVFSRPEYCSSLLTGPKESTRHLQMMRMAATSSYHKPRPPVSQRLDPHAPGGLPTAEWLRAISCEPAIQKTQIIREGLLPVLKVRQKWGEAAFSFRVANIEKKGASVVLKSHLTKPLLSVSLQLFDLS